MKSKIVAKVGIENEIRILHDAVAVAVGRGDSVNVYPIKTLDGYETMVAEFTDEDDLPEQAKP